MFKSKSALTQILFEEKSIYESWNKLAAAKTRASIHQLKWAQREDNVCLFHFFGALAELRWVWNEIMRQAAEKQLEFSKVFKNIYQDERVLEEAKKALEACKANIVKLQKQLETGKKKQEQIVSIELELGMQQTLCQHIETSIKEKTKKLELYKVEVVRKGAIQQAEVLLAMSEQFQSLCVAQTNLAGVLPLEPIVDSELHISAVERQMESVVNDLGEKLNLFPPKHGGIDAKLLFDTRVNSFEDHDHNELRNLGSKAHSMEYLFSNLTRCSSEDMKRVKRISYPLPLVPQETDPVASVSVKTRPMSAFMDNHAVVFRDKPSTPRRNSSSDKKHLSVISLEGHNEATILEDSCFDTGVATSPMGGHEGVVRLDSGSCESVGGDYADPIDALNSYVASKDKEDDPSYATLEEIRKLRDIQIAAAAASADGDCSHKRDDPGYTHIHEVVQSSNGEESLYSRPFDCLDLQADPVRISSRGGNRHAHRCMSPLTLRRVLSPTGEREEFLQSRPARPPISEGLLRHQESLRICKLNRHRQPTTFSDESRSPTPSDEGLDDRGHNTDGDEDTLRPLPLFTASGVSSSQPDLAGGEEGKEFEGDIPQSMEGPMKRLKSFLRNRASSDGHLAAVRIKHMRVSKTKVADKDVVEHEATAAEK